MKKIELGILLCSFMALCLPMIAEARDLSMEDG